MSVKRRTKDTVVRVDRAIGAVVNPIRAVSYYILLTVYYIVWTAAVLGVLGAVGVLLYRILFPVEGVLIMDFLTPYVATIAGFVGFTAGMFGFMVPGLGLSALAYYGIFRQINMHYFRGRLRNHYVYALFIGYYTYWQLWIFFFPSTAPFHPFPLL